MKRLACQCRGLSIVLYTTLFLLSVILLISTAFILLEG